MCDEIYRKCIPYYSDEDIAIGPYIILKVNNLFTKCDSCKRPRYNHITMFYFGDTFIKITSEMSGLSLSMVNDEKNTDFLIFDNNNNTIDRKLSYKNLNQVSLQSDTNLGNISNRKRTIGKSEFESQIFTLTDNEIENNLRAKMQNFYCMKTYRQAYANKEIKEITTYISCENCGEKLSEEFNLPRFYLDYSLSRLLQHYFFNSIENKSNKNVLDENGNCLHFRTLRVFKYDEILIKIFCGKMDYYNLNLVQYSSKKTQEELNFLGKELCKIKQEELLEILTSCNIKLNALIEKLLNNIKSRKSSEDSHNLHNLSLMNSLVEIDEYQTDEEKENPVEYLQEKIANLINLLKKSLKKQNTNFLNIDFFRYKSYLYIYQIYHYLIDLKNSKEFEKSYHFLCDEIEKMIANSKVNKEFCENGICKVNSQEELYEEEQDLQKINKRYSSEDLKSLALIFLIGYRRTTIINSLNIYTLVYSDKKNSNSIKSFSPNESKSYNSNEEKELNTPEKKDHFLILKNNSEIKSIPKRTKNKIVETPDLSIRSISLDKKPSGNTDDIFDELKKFIPVFENEPLTAVAFSLNSVKYLLEVYEKEGFSKNNIESSVVCPTTARSKNYFMKFIKSKLKKNNFEDPDKFASITVVGNFAKILINSKKKSEEFVLEKNKTSLSLFYSNSRRPSFKKKNSKILFNSHHHIFTSQIKINIPNNLQKFNSKKNNEISDNLIDDEDVLNIFKFSTKSSKTFKVKIFFAKEFEALRISMGISLSDYIKSLSATAPWASSGGKSKAVFEKSHDNLFIFKKLDSREFQMFASFAQDYFDYMFNVIQGQPSLLAKIYGMYEVSLDNNKYYYVVMEHLFFGLDYETNLFVYDLKGSETNRFVKPNPIKKTVVGLDTNFKIDNNGEPLPVIQKDKKLIEKAIENDTKFLAEQSLIDYSMLLIIDKKNKVIQLGIIDYLRIYTWDKQLENVSKRVIKAGAIPTIVNPNDYRKRFIEAMEKYFMEIPVFLDENDNCACKK